MVLISPQIDIVLIAAVLAVISQVMRRKIMDGNGMKEKQQQIKEKQKMMKELMKRDDPKAKNELDALQAEMMETMNTMMKGSMKMMMYSMILFVPAYWFLGSTYGNSIVPLPIPIPWFGAESFIEFYNETNWLGWYILISLICSFGLNMAINIYGKVKGGNNAQEK